MDAITAHHLDEAVRPDLLLPDDQRIARIDRDRWIGYGRAREILAELERILRSERRQRPDNLLIIGASNNGKTAIARRFLSGAWLPENPAATTSTIPAVLIQAPNGPRIAHLLTAIRAALGQPLGRRETIAQQRAETYRIMEIVGLRLPPAITRKQRGPSASAPRMPVTISRCTPVTMHGLGKAALRPHTVVRLLRCSCSVRPQAAGQMKPFVSRAQSAAWMPCANQSGPFRGSVAHCSRAFLTPPVDLPCS